MVSNAIGRFADSLDAILFSWLMYLVSGKPVLIALVFAANYLPTIVLQPFTGVLADKCSKKTIVIICDFGRAFIALLTLFLFYADRLYPWMLFPLTISISVFEAFRIPAGSALIPSLLDKDNIKAGNALNLFLRRICEALGTAVAGIIIVTVGPKYTLLIDACLFFVSGAVLFALSYVEKMQPCQNIHTIKNGFSQGAQYLKGKKEVLLIIVSIAIFNFLSVPYTVFQSIYFGEVLNFSADVLSMSNAAMLIGVSLGAVLVSKPDKLKIKPLQGYWILRLSYGTVSLFYIVLALSRWIPTTGIRIIVTISSYLIFGVVTGYFSVYNSSKLMEDVKTEYFGRISGISNSISLSMVPLSSLLASFLSANLTLTSVYLCIALIAFVFLVVSLVVMPR